MKVETIDATPTWQGILPALLLILDAGDKEGREVAKQELMKMAQGADRFRELAIVKDFADDEDKMKQVADVSQQIFWEAVGMNYPEIKTGDYPPDATFAFDSACERAIDTWLLFNDPKRQD